MAQVLVVTPTWVQEDGALAMRPECAESVAKQVFDGTFEHRITTDNPHPLGHRNVYHQYLRIRDLFLAGAWDALLMVEHDNRLPDAGALQRMYDTEADVVYAPYILRHGIRLLSTWQYLGAGYSNLGASLTNYEGELARAKAAGVWRVSGVGFGCTLVRRGVIEQVPFREWTPHTLTAPDMPFAQDCLRAGLLQVGRFDVPVDHWDCGEWIGPYMTVTNREYIALVTVNAYAGEPQQWIAMEEGKRYALPLDMAYDLARCGYIKEVSKPDAVGSANPDDGQPAADAGAQHGEPAPADRPGLDAKPAGGRGQGGRRGKLPAARRA